MKGLVLLIACLLAALMVVALTEGKSIAPKKQEKAVANEHESEGDEAETGESGTEGSASGSGSGGGTYTAKISVTVKDLFGLLT